LRDDCLLKAARVYMVFEILEKIGEVIKANPSVEQLEEEQFDHEFTVTIVSKEMKEDIQKKLMKVSEVEKVEVIPFSIDSLRQHEVEVTDSVQPTDMELKVEELEIIQDQ